MEKLLLALLLTLALTFNSFAVDMPPALADAVKADIGRTLRDPYSAQYEFVVLGDFNVCGFVNAKNLMGAYVGPKPFSALYYYQDGRYNVVANVFEPGTDLSGVC